MGDSCCHMTKKLSLPVLQMRHTELMERQTRYDEQSKQVAEKEAKISQFADLPADMAAAKAVYNNKLQALHDARKQLEEGLAEL